MSEYSQVCSECFEWTEHDAGWLRHGENAHCYTTGEKERKRIDGVIDSIIMERCTKDGRWEWRRARIIPRSISLLPMTMKGGSTWITIWMCNHCSTDGHGSIAWCIQDVYMEDTRTQL